MPLFCISTLMLRIGLRLVGLNNCLVIAYRFKISKLEQLYSIISFPNYKNGSQKEYIEITDFYFTGTVKSILGSSINYYLILGCFFPVSILNQVNVSVL